MIAELTLPRSPPIEIYPFYLHLLKKTLEPYYYHSSISHIYNRSVGTYSIEIHTLIVAMG